MALVEAGSETTSAAGTAGFRSAGNPLSSGLPLKLV
jgi:hypothetical protein